MRMRRDNQDDDEENHEDGEENYYDVHCGGGENYDDEDGIRPIIYPGKPFKHTLKNTQWRKITQMQLV